MTILTHQPRSPQPQVSPSPHPDPQSVVHWRCGVCGHTFTADAFVAHRNAFPPSHPLNRCLDGMEMTALEYEPRARGAWAIGIATQKYPSQARRLATVRQEREHYEITGEVLPHERLVAGTRADQLALVPEVRPVPAAARAAAEPADAVAKARRREQARLRKRRQRARDVTHPRQSTVSVTSPAPQPPGAASVANLGQFSTLSGGSARVHR